MTQFVMVACGDELLKLPVIGEVHLNIRTKHVLHGRRYPKKASTKGEGWGNHIKHAMAGHAWRSPMCSCSSIP